MPGYKVIPWFSQSWVGASEYYYTNPALDNASAAGVISNLLSNRARLLPTNVNINSVRISSVDNKRFARTLNPPSGLFLDNTSKVTIPSVGNALFGPALWTQEQFRVSLLLQTAFGSTAAPGGISRTVIRYLAPIPKAIAGTEPTLLDLDRDANFRDNLTIFTTFLTTNRFQVHAQDLSPTWFFGNPSSGVAPVGQVLQSSDSPPLIGLVLNPTIPSQFGPGSRIKITGFRPAKGTRDPTPNGTWTVAKTTSDGFAPSIVAWLQNSGNLVPRQFNAGPATAVRVVRPAWYPIDFITALRVGIRKRGKVFPSYRGRQRIRITLDP